MLFGDVIGQDTLKRDLLSMLSQNRLSHALLFLGNEGTGALPLALAFANFILLPKETKTSGTDLFGEAVATPFISPASPEDADLWMQKQPGFAKLGSLVHPDFHFSYPVIKKEKVDKPRSADFAAEWREFLTQQPYSNLFNWLQFIKAENKQGNISAEECNEIVRKMNLKSFEGGMKILLMWMPEALGKEGNKLLKLIEEPPPHTLFLLVAENENKILPTILSRTQLIRVPPLKETEISKALVDKGLVNELEAARIASFSRGNLLEAFIQAQQSENNYDFELKNWLNSIAQSKLESQVKWIEEMAKKGRENQKQFLQFFIHVIELAVRFEYISTGNDTAGRTDIEMAVRLNKICGMAEKEAMVHLLNQAIYYIERNANPKLLFHALTIKLYHIIRNKSLILV